MHSSPTYVKSYSLLEIFDSTLKSEMMEEAQLPFYRSQRETEGLQDVLSLSVPNSISGLGAASNVSRPAGDGSFGDCGVHRAEGAEM